jgi:membrane protease YdiL (CAAX protease family)
MADARAPVSWKARLLAVALELVLLVGGMVLGLLVIACLMVLGILPNPETEMWSAFIAGPLLMGTAAGFYLWVDRRGLHAIRSRLDGPEQAEDARSQPLVQPEDRPSVKSAALWIAMVFGLALCGSALLAFLLELVGWEVEEQEAVLDIVRGGWSFDLAMLILAAVFLAPVVEELLFRGHFFRRIHQRSGPVLAYVVSALMFAVVHGNLSGLLTYTWLALCFAYVYTRTGRLWAAMLVHLGNNAATLLLLMLYEP